MAQSPLEPDQLPVAPFGNAVFKDELAALRAQLDALVNALSDRLYEIDELGNVYDFKASKSDPTVADPEQMVGHNLADFLPSEVFETCMAAFQAAVKTGKHRGTCIPLESPQGRRWVELSISHKRQPNTPRHARLLVLAHDVTQRKEAEEALRKSEARYRVIFETTGTARSAMQARSGQL